MNEGTSSTRGVPFASPDAPIALRVLLIEDDPEDAEFTRAALTGIHWFRAVVSLSRSYADGLVALRNRQYDVVLLDHRLGALSGLDLLAEAFGGSVDVPVVLLTGVVDHAIDQAAVAAGVSHLLEKGEVNATRLERNIRYAIERCRIETELRRTRAFFRGAVDSLTDRVAILSADGTILAVNHAWVRFVEHGGADGGTVVGANYLNVCDSAREWSAEVAADVTRGLRDVIAGVRHGFTYEYRCQGATQDQWFVLKVSRFEDAGEIRVLAAHENITARRSAEAALGASDERYRTLIETAHEGIAALTGTGHVTYANARLAEVLGYTAEELVGQPLFYFMLETDQFHARTRFARRHRAIAETEEIRFRHRDGATIWFLVSYSHPLSQQPDVVGVSDVLVLLTDVTERKEGEIAMLAALHVADTDRRRLEATLTAIPVGVWLSDVNGRLTHTNPAAAAVWGGSAPHADSVAEYGVYKVWFPDSGIRLQPEDTALARTLATGETVSNELIEIERFDGVRAFVLNSAAPIRDSDGHIIGGVVVNVDVTDRQAAARERERLIALLDTERSQLTALFELAPSFLAVLRGPNYVFERVNSAYQRLVGQRELIGRSIWDALPDLRGQGFEAILEQVRETGTPFVGRNLPFTIVREPGGAPGTVYVTVVYQRMEDHTGEPLIVAHGWDATEEVLATEALKRNERRLRDQFDKLPVPTTLWEVAGDDFVLLDANEEAHLGDSSLRGAIGKVGGDIYPLRDDSHMSEMRRCLAENVVVRKNITYDFGSTLGVRHYELTLGPQQPDRVIVHAVDTTGRVALEAQLRQAQKMEAVGQLAGGVAHDFNNLLTVIGAHSTFLLDSLESDDPRREDVTAIHQSGVRAAGLTRQLLAFSRKQLLRPVVTDVNGVITEASKMLARLIGEDISIALDLAGDLGLVIVDPGQLEQTLINFAVNARDAMPNGGNLTITTRNVSLDPSHLDAVRFIPAGDYIQLDVRDTGEGMDAHTKSRLFEPFFTTKPAGRGTGLGLATVYGIVKQSNGYVLVESAPGAGATFSVYLPRTALAEKGEQREAAAQNLARGSETVLLIEDEEGVRKVATQVLKRLGYHVLTARDGHEALAIASTFDAPIHLALSDAVMPGLTGAETCRRLCELRPALKVIYMSGYTDDEVLRRGVVLSDVPFLEKPFTPTDLARMVRTTLDR